jgi:hypothetical protein
LPAGVDGKKDSAFKINSRRMAGEKIVDTKEGQIEKAGIL